jgi:hypothetical protein
LVGFVQPPGTSTRPAYAQIRAVVCQVGGAPLGVTVGAHVPAEATGAVTFQVPSIPPLVHVKAVHAFDDRVTVAHKLAQA